MRRSFAAARARWLRRGQWPGARSNAIVNCVSIACPRCEAPSVELVARGPAASQCTRCKAVFSNERAARAKSFSVHDGASGSDAARNALADANAPATALGIVVTPRSSPADAPYRGSVERRDEAVITLAVVWSTAYDLLAAWWLVTALVFAACAMTLLSGYGRVPPILGAPFALATILSIYGFAAALVNRTTIEVRGAELTVRHAPLPWWGTRTIERGRIDQLFCDLVEGRSRRGRVARYRVLLRTTDGDELVLVRGLMEPEQALFIEASIERAIGVQDRSVAGELAEKSRARR